MWFIGNSCKLVFVCVPGLNLSAMWTCVAHAGYLVLCAVLLTFLRCPGFSRAMLLLTVPLNAVAELNQQPALDLCGLSLLLLTLSLGTKTHVFLGGNQLLISSTKGCTSLAFFPDVCRSLVDKSAVGVFPV